MILIHADSTSIWLHHNNILVDNILYIEGICTSLPN